jgi:hypothetical protein
LAGEIHQLNKEASVKRYLALVAGLIFVLGFTAVAFAIHAEIPSDTQAVVAKGTTQITLGGEIRARGEYKEVDFNNDTPGDSYYDSRVRLSVDAQVTPNTSGFVQVEAGGGYTADNYTWGTSTEKEWYSTGSCNDTNGDDQCDVGTITVDTKSRDKDQYGAKGIYNVGNAKRGQFNILQAWILHKGSGLLGVPAGVKVGHMPLALGNKLFFDHTKFGDDAIVFFVDPTKELHIGLLTAKFREGQNALSDDANAYVGLFNYKLANGSISGDITYVDDQGFSADGLHFWNFGLRGDMKVDPITIRADVELQTGSTGQTPDRDFAGYAFLVGADFKVDPVTLTAEFAYGSGDDDANDDKDKRFVTSLGADPHFTYVYEYRTNNACGVQYGGICNTMYVKLGASAQPVKDLTASLNLFWLRANEVPAGGDKDIGIEIDPKITYKIDKNLTYWIEGGYLMAGDFWGPNADDAYAIRHGIMLSF